MSRQETHTVRLLSPNSAWASELCEHGLKKHYIKSLMEIDVTNARRAIRAYRKTSRNELSFFAWIVKCIVDAVDLNKAVHGCKYGRNRVLIFDDVDVSIPIEREMEGARMPMPYVLRRANKKPLQDIHAEIAQAKRRDLSEGEQVLSRPAGRLVLRVFPSLPRFVKAAFWDRFDKNPFLQKRIMGTVGITSVAIAGNTTAWAVPISVQPLCFALGSVTKRAAMTVGKLEMRDYLAMTVMFDHDVTDGAPAARFVSQLLRMMENAHGLSEPVQQLAESRGRDPVQE